MKTNLAPLLREQLQHMTQAADYLAFSYDRSREIIHQADWTPEQMERLESLASRFARLSDLLTQKVMRIVDELELTPEGTLLDRINRAEKRGWVDSAADLVRICELRNLIAHEYAADKLDELYQTIIVLTPQLLAMPPKVRKYAEDLLEQYSRYQ
jgi:uncharacterized protein YutE (UPF0331/DUF86 family)